MVLDYGASGHSLDLISLSHSLFLGENSRPMVRLNLYVSFKMSRMENQEGKKYFLSVLRIQILDIFGLLDLDPLKFADPRGKISIYCKKNLLLSNPISNLLKKERFKISFSLNDSSSFIMRISGIKKIKTT